VDVSLSATKEAANRKVCIYAYRMYHTRMVQNTHAVQNITII